jgi:Zn-finger nucleic acid-binding protein
MQCPIDQADLTMSERHGIEIDYCPRCRGVWLDRGELDKIIDRSMSMAPRTEAHDVAAARGRGYDGGHHGGSKQRRGWLKDLFD